jgi:hypothetical protein
VCPAITGGVVGDFADQYAETITDEAGRAIALAADETICRD